MAISLTVKVDDPEVEALLRYLESRSLTPRKRAYLLHRTLAWMGISDKQANPIASQDRASDFALVALESALAKPAWKGATVEVTTT